MLELGQLQQHIQALDKGNDAAQRQAIHSLQELEQEDWAAAPTAAFRAIMAALLHHLQAPMKPPFIHKVVTSILGKMAPRFNSAIPQLILLLKEGVPDAVRETAATALGRFGSEARDAVDPLIEISTGKPTLAAQAVRALSEIGCADQRVRSALTSLWVSAPQSQGNHVQVGIALCKLGIDAEGLLGFLTRTLMTSQDYSLREAAAEALAWRNKNDLDVVPALLAATLSDKNEEVCKRGQEALDRLKLSHEKAIQLCAAQLKDSVYAEAALRKSGPLAVPALIGTLGVKDPLIRAKAARTLACLGEEGVDAVPALTTALHDKDPEFRLAAAKGLWNITKKADAVVPVLVHLLEEKRPVDADDSEGRRRFLQTVIEALWRIGPPAKAAMPALIAKAKDKNRLVSESAQNALKKIAPPVPT